MPSPSPPTVLAPRLRGGQWHGRVVEAVASIALLLVRGARLLLVCLRSSSCARDRPVLCYPPTALALHRSFLIHTYIFSSSSTEGEGKLALCLLLRLAQILDLHAQCAELARL
mmetsp:Transcript_16778/g.33831  ORF Transcript_16778/g.33831 Transcript_16778/m.33831 type:complete len:113 (-) Transcript_16778:216-554(-)